MRYRTRAEYIRSCIIHPRITHIHVFTLQYRHMIDRSTCIILLLLAVCTAMSITLTDGQIASLLGTHVQPAMNGVGASMAEAKKWIVAVAAATQRMVVSSIWTTTPAAAANSVTAAATAAAEKG